MAGAGDLDALLRLLRDDPQRREEVRRALFGDEPDVRTELAALARAQRTAAEQLAALTGRVDALAGQVEALAGHVEALARHLEEVARQLAGLVTQVSTIGSHVDRLRGDSLERRYREKGHAYLARIARRLCTVPADALEDILDPAVDDGRLSAEDATEVRLLDAVFRGRIDGHPHLLAIEVSVGIDTRDVTRAHRRAGLLARAGIPTVAVVAGEYVDSLATRAANDLGVWQVTNGRAVAPEHGPLGGAAC